MRLESLATVNGWIVALPGGREGHRYKIHQRMRKKVSLGVYETPEQRCPLSRPVHIQLLIFSQSSWCHCGAALTLWSCLCFDAKPASL